MFILNYLVGTVFVLPGRSDIDGCLTTNTFMPGIVGRLKSPSKPTPSEAPSFEKLRGDPPYGNASKDEWDKWHEKNCCGTVDFWMDKDRAVKYRCPDNIEIILKGLSHEHNMQVKADDRLFVASSSIVHQPMGLPLK
jgi:hypothetical protein